MIYYNWVIVKGVLNSPNLVKIYKNRVNVLYRRYSTYVQQAARRRLFYIICLNSMLSNKVLQMSNNIIIKGAVAFQNEQRPFYFE